jgi:hypothetical protein
MSYLQLGKTTYRQVDAKNDPNDEGGLRLLVHNEPLKMLFPHKDIWLRYPYGRRRLCNSIQEVDVYNDAS